MKGQGVVPKPRYSFAVPGCLTPARCRQSSLCGFQEEAERAGKGGNWLVA